MAAKKGAKSSGGSSSSSSESNTGLIVSLVLFVLLAIGLGVTTYLGYAGQEDLRKAAKDSDAKAVAAGKRADSEEGQKVALRLATGVADAGDKSTFNRLKGASGVAEQIAKLKDFPKWDFAGSDTPPKSYTGIIDDMQKAAKDRAARNTAAVEALNDDKKKLSDEIQDLTGKLQAAQKAVQDANTKLVAEQNRKASGSDESSKKIKELSEQVQTVTNEKQNLDVEKSREIKRLTDKIDSMDKVRTNFQARVGPIMEKLDKIKGERPEIRELSELYELLAKQFDNVNPLSNDVPKGAIVKMDRQTGLAYVNLGSADFIKPGVTFSVHGAGSTGKTLASRERKGAIEIVTVLEPHLSTAKVVEATNAVRDPLLPGDLLFNPVWSPNNREHVAIAGIIDLNGDGIDDTQDLIRALEKQGVVVDAWLDLKERAIKGPGMSEKTTYLILGERPALASNAPLENNPLATAVHEVVGKMDEMKNKARDFSTMPVTYRRYLAMIGFKLPKVMNPADFNASSYLRGTQSKGAPKDESKEEKPK